MIQQTLYCISPPEMPENKLHYDIGYSEVSVVGTQSKKQKGIFVCGEDLDGGD